jgi:hypothetical protein
MQPKVIASENDAIAIMRCPSNRAGAAVVDITSTDGTVLHISADAVVIITGPVLENDPPNRSYVTGPGPAVIATDESVLALLARLHPTKSLLQFTRPDGQPVWLKGAAISLVTAPTPDDVPDGLPASAVIYVGGKHQAVQESVSNVLSALANQGIKF